MSFYIKHRTGEKEEFDIEKFRRSLTRPGASKELVDDIINSVQKNKSHFETTEDLYRFALEKLKQKEPSVAARYDLKKALFEFGPTGFPFEKYIAEVLKAQGYQVMLNKIVGGWCVDHEVDIIAKKDNDNFLVECKFHNEPYYRTDVQVVLYTEARYQDIKRTWTQETPQEKIKKTWVFTNTSFTYEALKYGNCMGMQLTSWDYPKEDNLAELINKYGLHPITAVPSLNHKQKKYFIENGFVLGANVEEHIDLLKAYGMTDSQIKNLINECKSICEK